MNALIWIIGGLLALLALAWVGRVIAQKATDNKPYFRDMPLGIAFGYVFAVAAVLFSAWYFFQPKIVDNVPQAGVIFFRWAVIGLLSFAAVSWVFRAIFRSVGTPGTKKLFRSMPLTAAFGIMMIIIYAFVSIFAGLIAPYGQEEILGAANVVAGGDPALGGDPKYPLGTDQIGRDILSRLIYGAQNTVGIAFVTTCLAFLLGGTFGFLAAVLGGWLDQLLSRMVDALMAIPSLIFSLLLMTIATAWAGSEAWLVTIYMIFIIAVIDSTRVFRLSRAVGQSIVVMDYIEAAKLRGEGMGYLIFREILPNAVAPLLAEFGLRFCFVFLTIASLSFLGVGIQPPKADWGTMVRDLSQFINFAAFAPNVAVTPLLAAGAIALLTVAVNFVVDWMLHRSSGLKE
jgi:peptide/nickel transport system permease protein